MIHYLGWGLFWLLLAGLVADAVHNYLTTGGSQWTRFLAVGKTSATILAARAGAIGGLGLNAVVEIANAVGAPGVASVLESHMDPKVVGYVLVGSAFVIEMARRRTLKVPVIGLTPTE